jgi:hypothetical protein
VLAALPARGCLVGDVALPLARRGAPLVTFRVEGELVTPGDGIADYLDAHRVWLEQRGRGASYVAPGAKIGANVELSGSVIGAGAQVSGEGRCEGVVAWPGARFAAPLADAVVMTSGRIVPRPRLPDVTK